MRGTGLWYAVSLPQHGGGGHIVIPTELNYMFNCNPTIKGRHSADFASF